MSEFERDPLADTKEVFRAWLENFRAFHDDQYLLDQLAACQDLLPETMCQQLKIDVQSTYADAVELFRSQWIAIESDRPTTSPEDRR